jgi:hypothetical protein
MALSKEQILTAFDSRLTQIDSEVIRPLTEYTWTRDLPLIDDLSKTVRAIAWSSIKGVGQGTTSADGRSWLGDHANDLKGVDVAMDANAVRVFTAGREAHWSEMELAMAAEAGGIALDAEQVEAINDLFQGEAQAVGYLGDSAKGIAGLLNATDSVERVDGEGVLESGTWDDVIAAVDKQIQAAKRNAANALTPNRILVSPDTYSKLFSMKAPDDRHFSVIDYIEKESLGRKQNGSMQVLEVKELAGIGKSKKDRMVFYTPDRRYVAYHIRSLWREKTYDRGLDFCAAYLWRLSEVQIRRPESILYVDNL